MRSSTRFTRGITALVTLLVLLIGVPVALVAAGGNPMPSWHSIGRGLTHSDASGHLVLSVGVVIVWVAWFVFATSVGLELFGRVRNRPALLIPGLRTPGRAAARLVASVEMLGTFGGATGAFAAAPAPVVSTASTATIAPVTADPVVPASTMVYHVQRGDRLGDIAKRFLGDFNEFGRIANTNRHLVGASGPDLIRPGWELALPADALDHGATAHAGGAVTRFSGSVVQAATLPRQQIADSAPDCGLVTLGAVTPLADGHAADVPTTDDGPSPAFVAAVAALPAGVLEAHLNVWRRRSSVLMSGRGVRPPDVAGAGPAPLDDAVDRIDLALRELLALLADRPAAHLPDIMGSWLLEGAVHLMLTAPCPPPPLPWIANGLMWTLPAEAKVGPYDPHLAAPMPALVTVGVGDNPLHLDLERLGVLTVGGEPEAATGLLRHLAAELSHGVWSRGVTVGIAGFGTADTERLVGLGNGRIKANDSIAEAIEGAMNHVEAVADRQSPLGAGNVMSGRAGASRAQAAWMAPYTLLLAGPSIDDLQRLEMIDAYLSGLGRGQVGVVASITQARMRGSSGRWHVEVGEDHTAVLPAFNEHSPVRVPAVRVSEEDLDRIADANALPPGGRHQLFA